MLDFAADGVGGTFTGTSTAALALIRIDYKACERLTLMCGATFFADMCFIFISEISESRKDRIRCCLTESTE